MNESISEKEQIDFMSYFTGSIPICCCFRKKGYKELIEYVNKVKDFSTILHFTIKNNEFYTELREKVK